MPPLPKNLKKIGLILNKMDDLSIADLKYIRDVLKEKIDGEEQADDPEPLTYGQPA